MASLFGSGDVSWNDRHTQDVSMMSDNTAPARNRSGSAAGFAIAVVVVLIFACTIWTDCIHGGMHSMMADNERRLDILERVGSPAVAEIRVLQMRAMQSVAQRRIDALEVTLKTLKDRLDAMSPTSDTPHVPADPRD
jgi:hypothetical protein